MKKIALALMFLITISFVSASTFYSIGIENSNIPAQEVSQINSNSEYINNTYGIGVGFYISDASGSPFLDSLSQFNDFWGYQNGQKKTWNLLIYYNIKQNELRFVTYKYCSYNLDELRSLRQMGSVQKVLEENNPSYNDIGQMFVDLSNSIKSIIISADPNSENSCILSNTHILKLRSNEQIIPTDVLKSLYSVTMGTSWSDSTPGGITISKNLLAPNTILGIIPISNPKKDEFESLLREHTAFTDSQIESYYNLITTTRGIFLEPDYSDSILFHERAHWAMTYNLTTQEQQALISARNDFLDYYKNNGYLSSSSPPIATFFFPVISQGNWQELYAYMAQFQKYPQAQSQLQYLDQKARDMFASMYPQEYQIYQKFYNDASQ